MRASARLASVLRHVAPANLRVRSAVPPALTRLATSSALLGESSPDPAGLLEYSVVYTDRALNHMSAPFKKVMLDIGDMLKEVYNAENAVIIPGSGTYAMEAVARHFATNKKAMVLRNGYFSYRWTHIFETCDIPSEHIIVKAQPQGPGIQAQYAPCPIEELEAMI